MSSENRFEETVGIESPELGKVVDKDILAFLSSLIEQNAELTQKLDLLHPRTKFADDIVAEAHRKAEAIRLLAEKEANDRATAIISESENKAKVEADRIVAGARKEAEDIRLLIQREARDRAAAIIGESQSKAKLEADRILAEAKEKGQAIIEGETKSAQQYGLLIINKAKEKAISILEEANVQVLVATSKLSQKARR
jgi:vacuolar-type H+-ATPase subunit H